MHFLNKFNPELSIWQPAAAQCPARLCHPPPPCLALHTPNPFTFCHKTTHAGMEGALNLIQQTLTQTITPGEARHSILPLLYAQIVSLQGPCTRRLAQWYCFPQLMTDRFSTSWPFNSYRVMLHNNLVIAHGFVQ